MNYISTTERRGGVLPEVAVEMSPSLTTWGQWSRVLVKKGFVTPRITLGLEREGREREGKFEKGGREVREDRRERERWGDVRMAGWEKDRRVKEDESSRLTGPEFGWYSAWTLSHVLWRKVWSQQNTSGDVSNWNREHTHEHTHAAERDTCNVDIHTDVDADLTRACTVLAQSVGDGPITTIGWRGWGEWEEGGREG